jgi:hypothetical protein
MFEDLYDGMSFFWLWRWPDVEGHVTEALVECLHANTSYERCRLSVTYEFSVGNDGPYTGESFWDPSFSSKRRAHAARHKFHIGQTVAVRYRRDDPSINRLDRSVWRQL